MLTFAIKTLIKGYQKILSPLIGNQCRYHPTCSCYAHESYEKHGFVKGTILTVMRVCSCHPFSKRPWTDPVPERFALRDLLLYKNNTSNQTKKTDKGNTE